MIIFLVALGVGIVQHCDLRKPPCPVTQIARDLHNFAREEQRESRIRVRFSLENFNHRPSFPMTNESVGGAFAMK